MRPACAPHVPPCRGSGSTWPTAWWSTAEDPRSEPLIYLKEQFSTGGGLWARARGEMACAFCAWSGQEMKVLYSRIASSPGRRPECSSEQQGSSHPCLSGFLRTQEEGSNHLAA